MFTLISDQTAWYNKQSDKLRTVSKNMNMEHPKGRDKELRSIHTRLMFLLSSISINISIRKAFGCDTEKLDEGLKETNSQINWIEKQIIKNNYNNEAFENGGVQWQSLVHKARSEVSLDFKKS